MKRSTSIQLDYDRRVLLIVVFITVIGASIVASSSSYFSMARFSDAYFLLKRHVLRILVAVFFLWLAIHIDYRIYRRLSPYAFALGLCLLAGLFVFGYVIRSANSQYLIKPLRVTLQPGEFGRFSLVLFLAFWISRKGEELKEFRKGFLPAALAIVAVVALMAAQPDYGTAAATASIAILVLFLGGARLTHLAAFLLTAGGAAAVRIWTDPHVRDRIFAFINQGEDLKTANWQVMQSLIALGSGGIFGAGLGGSRQKLSWLPDSHTDFIFSIVGEEVGLVGTFMVSLLFLLLILRALKISRHCGDTFGELLAAGLGISVFVYAVLNMGVAAGILPVTGLPLPFLSYGGSALVMNAFSIGIVLNVSKKRVVTTRRRGGRLST